MIPAGRFLYLDRAQAEVLKREQAEDGSWERIVAWHDGYQRFGMMHIRSVTADKDDHWLIEDRIQPLADDVQRAMHTVRLHWLLPDWKWKMDDSRLMIEALSPYGWVTLRVIVEHKPSIFTFQSSIFRAGKLLHGTGPVNPTWGWISPTYGVKRPALSFVVMVVDELPLTITSEWNFPND
jgi:uncharacterized heparinase superfamily protein